ncbi:uncharacterized protein LOC125004540 [Mugil cephalus]|uniref:uncharacterized protein LOC125004540 n=1 Tax=Mugil cephalus TaxID=48193 RepID=UPI001FB6AEA1|nr:uncharacterized protein LOC125004540 [Mugil cephalus]
MADSAGKMAIPATVFTAKQATRKRKSDFEQKLSKGLSDNRRNKCRINIGQAYTRWRELRDSIGLRLDAELAVLLMDSYLQTTSDGRSQRPSLEMGSSTETCESVHREHLFMMSSSNEAEQEQGEKDQRPNGVVREEEEEEEFCTSLSVGDGRYLVDLGSPSEFIVDEDCIIQLMKSCRECNKQCTVRKQVKGLKLVVYQACCFCQSRSKWTNLPDEDDEEQL